MTHFLCHSHENQRISTVSSTVTLSENMDKNFYDAKNPFKINELETQEKKDTIINESVTLEKPLKIKDLRTVTHFKCHSGIESFFNL